MKTSLRLFWKKNRLLFWNLDSVTLNAGKFFLIFSEVNKMSNSSNGESGNKSEFRLKNAPEDGISSVRFGPNSSQFLLVSSWDKNVRLYDVTNNNLRVKYSHQRFVSSKRKYWRYSFSFTIDFRCLSSLFLPKKVKRFMSAK